MSDKNESTEKVAAQADKGPKGSKRQKGKAENEVTPGMAPENEQRAAPGIDPMEVFEHMVQQRQAEAEAVERRRLGAPHLAKIARQRLKLAAERGGGRALNHAIALNAADLGMSPEDYREMLQEV